MRAAQSAGVYLSYSETDFEFFRPAGATGCTYIGAAIKERLPKLNFLLIFDKNVEYKQAYPLRDFHKICRVCSTSFQVLKLLKVSWICSRGYETMGF